MKRWRRQPLITMKPIIHKPTYHICVKTKRYHILLGCLLFFYSHLLAQTPVFPGITGDYKNLPAKDFLQQLEKQTGWNFYYNEAQFDSLKVNISVQNKPLPDVLKQAFAGTGLGFSVDNEKHVFINKGLLVQTQLNKLFFTASAADIKDTSNSVVGFFNPTNKAVSEDSLYLIGDASAGDISSPDVTVAGYVKDSKSDEPVIGASVYIDETKTGVATDQYGYFSIHTSKGKHILYVQSIGMHDTKRQLNVRANGKLNIAMPSEVIGLKNVTVSSEKMSNIKGMQMGMQKLDINAIKHVPVAFGEADVLRVILTMPGVKSVGEASTGLNVRGGAADQNLVLFNDATIYNPSHFFGLFSAFNPEVVKDVELYKASIPAQYGGRLSSVLNITSREGNKKDFTGSAGIGPLTSRLNLEGPIKKNKASFIVGARTTYADWLLNLLPDQYKNSRARFYDLNAVMNYEIDKKNTLYVTGYLSGDRFNLNSDTIYNYGNRNVSVKWKHIFSNKLNMLITTGYDNYYYKISSIQNPVTAYSLRFDVNQYYFRTHFNYYFSNKHFLEWGANGLLYKLHPGTYLPDGKQSLVIPQQMQAEQGLESALYLSDKYTVNSALSLEGGVRYSMFNFLGPYMANDYPANSPKTEDNIIGTTFYQKGKIVKTYSKPEIRLSARYAFDNTLSVKAGYNTTQQYIHVLSNTAAIAPTDIWKLSDVNIKPQFGSQISAGLYKNFKSNTIETSVEVYYKKIENYLDYKSGAVLVLNPHIETDVISTKGKAYGIEAFAKKSIGKLNGWVSYTYSRTLLKADSTSGEVINGGKYYPANYDQPHSFTFIGNYRINHRFSVSLNSTYSTGRPITLPIGRFYFAGSERTLYADRNAYRIPDYFRTDFSMNLDGNFKLHQRFHNSWTIGVYNATARKNPYSVYFISENGVVDGYKFSIFGTAIPYINFNVRF